MLELSILLPDRGATHRLELSANCNGFGIYFVPKKRTVIEGWRATYEDREVVEGLVERYRDFRNHPNTENLWSKYLGSTPLREQYLSWKMREDGLIELKFRYDRYSLAYITLAEFDNMIRSLVEYLRLNIELPEEVAQDAVTSSLYLVEV